MARRSAPSKGILLGILLVVVTVVVFLFLRGSLLSPGKQAIAAVEEFYQNEQVGEFSGSWGLFHSTMRERFSKGHYIQDRAHVFMNHFGVETFTYTLSKPEKVDNWKMSKKGPVMKNVYKFLVTQTYKGKYGNFDLKQEVIAVEEKGKWKIAWDYKQ
ncbi:hypothetical protein [Neobacillus sp. FSL H8-0543]|uniref:hypothetical protein n=1 Tax=Neobacillus sp. FSL H8-0543 TaxID=2954672 RepID=UPI003158E252